MQKEIDDRDYAYHYQVALRWKKYIVIVIVQLIYPYFWLKFCLISIFPVQGSIAIMT